ncbi:MAG: succinylglutamate desuccinylase/aspartoacylase family protein [Acidimicrobiales bacterium]
MTERAARPPRQPRNSPFTLAGVTVAPGRRRNVELPVAALPTDTSLSMSVAVLCGLRPGPTVWLSGAVHGDELNGIEIIRQLLRLLHPKELAGTLLAVPIVNVFGFLNESRYLPDHRDLNRSFPGSARGSLTAQLANHFVTEIVLRSQYGIDFHTGSDHRVNVPQLRVDLLLPEVERMAKAFAAPVTVHASYRDGSLRTYCSTRGIPLLVYEGGEAHRFDADAVRVGTDGTLRVLAELDMWHGDVPPPRGSTVLVEHSHWERARRSGIVRIDVEPGQRVEQGAVLGVIANALGERPTPVRASTPGIVLGVSRHPMVAQGDALVHIADTSESARGGVARPPGTRRR